MGYKTEVSIMFAFCKMDRSVVVLVSNTVIKYRVNANYIYPFLNKILNYFFHDDILNFYIALVGSSSLKNNLCSVLDRS